MEWRIKAVWPFHKGVLIHKSSKGEKLNHVCQKVLSVPKPKVHGLIY